VAGFSADETEGIDERGDLSFRLRVAMLGSLGISARIDRWPAADFATVARHIALYREKLRAIIHHGDQYLLTQAPPGDGNGDWAAIWYVAKDRARGVLFAFRLAGEAPSRSFPLAGLSAQRHYRVTTEGGEVARARGEALAQGLDVTILARFQSELCLVEAGEPEARSVEAE
jgi:alpha-galactosidase